MPWSDLQKLQIRLPALSFLQGIRETWQKQLKTFPIPVIFVGGFLVFP
jgi:hypothetical protein